MPSPTPPALQNAWHEDDALRAAWRISGQALEALGVPSDIGGRGTKEWQTVPLHRAPVQQQQQGTLQEEMPAVFRHPGAREPASSAPAPTLPPGILSPAGLGGAGLVAAAAFAGAAAVRRRRRRHADGEQSTAKHHAIGGLGA